MRENERERERMRERERERDRQRERKRYKSKNELRPKIFFYNYVVVPIRSSDLSKSISILIQECKYLEDLLKTL